MLGLAEKPEPNFHNKMSLQQKRKRRGYSKTVTKVTTQIFVQYRESDYPLVHHRSQTSAHLKGCYLKQAHQVSPSIAFSLVSKGIRFASSMHFPKTPTQTTSKVPIVVHAFG